MRPSLDELRQKVRLGEDTFLECKEVRLAGGKVQAPHRHALADELAAMANGRGGCCLLGVGDDRRILGIPLAALDAVEAWVREGISDAVTPPLLPIIERVELPDADGVMQALIRVDVFPSLFVHESPGGYLHRVGSAKRKMPPDYLARLFQQRSQSRLIRYDETPVPTCLASDLDEALWRRFAPADTQDEDATLMAKLGLARREDDGRLHATVAGVLLATQRPTEWLPQAHIQAVAYRGTALGAEAGRLYQLDAADFDGPLDEQVAKACHFVIKNMRVRAFKEFGRQDLPDYDLVAVTEALINAVAHRDYAIHGSKIRLRMFDDRLELFSPGALPNTLTVEDLPYRQSTRNETIASLLARCPMPALGPDQPLRHRKMMERRGEGVPLILRSGDPNQAPSYRLIGDAELLLTIPVATPLP